MTAIAQGTAASPSQGTLERRRLQDQKTAEEAEALKEAQVLEMERVAAQHAAAEAQRLREEEYHSLKRRVPGLEAEISQLQTENTKLNEGRIDQSAKQKELLEKLESQVKRIKELETKQEESVESIIEKRSDLAEREYIKEDDGEKESGEVQDLKATVRPPKKKRKS